MTVSGNSTVLRVAMVVDPAEPTQRIRTSIGKSSRLFISILVIQDHIEYIGKPILLKGDAVLFNGLLAQMLSDIALKPSTTFSIQILSKT